MSYDEKSSREKRAASQSRREAIKTLGSMAGGLAAASVLPMRFARAASDQTLRIGYVSPATGPLAVFSQPDPFTLQQLRKVLAGGVLLGGKRYAVDILYKDSQSSASRAADVTSELILKDNVDIVVAASTPATTVPVANQCEVNGVPCVTTDTPWQSYVVGRGDSASKGWEWTYHYFWGLEDVVGVYTSMWRSVSTDRTVGALWPNDTDGDAWSDHKFGFPPTLTQERFKLVDPGRYKTPADDFTSYIDAFKSGQADIVTGVIPPPDFATFWNQSGQQGFKPRIVTVAKATEFPAAVNSFGSRADGLSVEVWWSPAFPYSSSLTGQSCAQFARAYTAFSGQPWSVALGFKHSLFEVAIDTFKRAADRSPDAIRDALRATSLNTIVGHVDFSKGPAPNIGKTPLVGGQWQQRAGNVELLIVEHSLAPGIPLQSNLEFIRYT